jgi:hypothetical protein
VLQFEKQLSESLGDRKFNFETKGKQTVRVFSEDYSRRYHEMLAGMVERQFRASVKMTGSIWFTAWVDAGQPDLKSLIHYKPSEAELAMRKQELQFLKQRTIETRPHETDNP